MKAFILSLMLVFVAQSASAALPPRVQNTKDLDVMVDYIKLHPAIAYSLDSIDVRHHTIHYRGDCRAVFGRKFSIKPPGWVGPADPLEFKETNCPE